MTNNSFRNYRNVNEAIKYTYKQSRINQTIKYSKKMKDKYCNFNIKMDIWDIIDKLNTFVDISDPDINLPNSYHGFQTAECIRKDGHPKWLQLVGLIHDIGKIIFIKGNDEDGTTINNQWGIVGDTFLLGCKIPDTIIYPEFNSLNPDMNDNKYNTENGIYKDKCGLNNTICSWGHDEYLYQILIHNKTKLPKEALYIIRYHSLYVYHKNEEYLSLMNQDDHKYIQWLKIFNNYDLYTKSDKIINVDNIKEYYTTLIKEYFYNDFLYI